MFKPPRTLVDFGITTLAVGAALLVRWLVDPLVGDRIPFVTVLGAVAVAVGFGGLYPALFATFLGYLGCDILFFEPRGTLQPLQTPREWITFAGYLFACFTVICFGLLMRRAQRKHQRAALELAALNQRKDQLLATVAHELRNPLGPISHAVRVLRTQGSARPELGHAQDMIDRQVHHLTRLIDDLVAMDRIARHQLELRTTRINFAEEIQEAVAASQSLISAQCHDLRVSHPASPLYIEADPDRLEQIIVNLIANAVKFTPSGGCIDILIEREGQHAIMRVQDTGSGIRPDALPRLFEMFFQADPMQPGLGIGLALVKQLVDLHGGSVTAESEGPDLGSTFVVRFPLHADQGPTHEAGAIHAAVPASEREPIIVR